jgi:hypothetical protein
MKPGKTENDIWIWRPSNFFQFYRRKDCFIDTSLRHPPHNWIRYSFVCSCEGETGPQLEYGDRFSDE